LEYAKAAFKNANSKTNYSHTDSSFAYYQTSYSRSESYIA